MLIKVGFFNNIPNHVLYYEIEIIFILIHSVMVDRWYDVQDDDGLWRIGQCFIEDRLGTKTIGLDGFHPNFTTLFFTPIRTHTYGLTIPEDQKPLRQVLTNLQLQNGSGRLNLYLMKTNYLQLDPYQIKSKIRTQFLILVDKIFGTPFSICQEIQLFELKTSKFFINILALYTRVIQFSKTFMAIIETNETARQLYKSIYQLTVMANLIFGIHPHSIKLYDINSKSMGYIVYFISDSGLIIFRNFFKGISNISKPQQFDYQVCVIVTNLCLDLCEKSKSSLLEGANQPKTMLLLDQIINSLKYLAEQNQSLKMKMNKDQSFISRIQALYCKFRSNKTCPLRKYISKQEHKDDKIQKTAPNPIQKMIKEEEVQKLQERIKKLQILVANQSKQSIPNEQPKNSFNFQKPELPIENLGEEMFLGSLQWALETGDIETAKKLTKWRKSLLQIGRITGWEVALAIGARTYKKQQITAGDIIQANYEHLSKLHKN